MLEMFVPLAIVQPEMRATTVARESTAIPSVVSASTFTPFTESIPVRYTARKSTPPETGTDHCIPS